MALADFPRVGFVGLGLIGGSLALALRESGYARELVAFDADAEALQQGLRAGVIDRSAAGLPELMAVVDIAVLATPTLASEALLLEMLRRPGSAQCVTDVASVKGSLCAAASTLPQELAARYTPGHPIAGSERSGVTAADGGLFQGQRVILTPGEFTSDASLAMTTQLWTAAGARVQQMEVTEHDAVLAATSHLPHVLAYALVDALARSPLRDDIFRFAAGGFRDFTRIASSDPVMWRDIALSNRAALLAALDDFSAQLGMLRAAIDEGDSDALESTFRAAKTARDGFARELASRDADAL